MRYVLVVSEPIHIIKIVENLKIDPNEVDKSNCNLLLHAVSNVKCSFDTIKTLLNIKVDV